MRRPPKYVHGYIDCRGRPRWYLRRAGHRRVPLPGLPWSPEFMAAYEAAMAGEKIEPGKSKIKPGSVADLITLYYQTAAFTRLSDATRQTYRGILDRFRAGYGDLPVARLEEQHIMAILDKKAATPAAANNLRRMLRAIMKLAKQRKMIKLNPMTDIEPMRYKVKGFKDWPDADIKLFTDAYAIGTRERLAFELMLCAAPRRSDVIRLGPEHVIGGRLVYRQKKTGAEIDIPEAKERVATRVGPGPARDVMAELLNGSRFDYVLLGSAEDQNALTRVVLVAKSAPDNTNAAEQPAQPAQAPGNQAARVFQAPPPAEVNDSDTAEQYVEEKADEVPSDVETPTSGDQPEVKTPQQMLQEMQQRQLQLQQQLQQQQQTGQPAPNTPPRD